MLALNHSLLDQNLRGKGRGDEGCRERGRGIRNVDFLRISPQSLLGLCQVWDLLQSNKIMSGDSHPN